MTPEPSFAELMTQLQNGDEDAAARIFNRFVHRLIALAHSRLDRLPRQKADPEDVVQSAFRSFFCRQANGQFDLSGWDAVWAMLTVITLRKCGHRIEYFHAARRDIQREAARPAARDESSSSWHVIAQEPTPSQAALLTETVEQLMSRLDESERPVLVLSMQGYSVPEISGELGRSERSVRRILKNVKVLLEHWRADSAGEP